MPAVLSDQRRLSGAFFIKLEHILPDPAQPRRTLDPEKLAELTASIRQLGVIQPILVRYIAADQRYCIIAGERRYQAALAAGLTEVPCWVRQPEEQQILVHQLVENWQRADLHPFEIADALVRLQEANGLSQRDLVKLTGKSESEISRLLLILRLPPDVQKEARADLSGEFTRRHLIAIASANPAAQRQVFQLVREKGLTALETEKLVREEKRQAVTFDQRGQHRAEYFRFKTRKAMVIVQFRRGAIGNKDILDALGEAIGQAAKPTPKA